MPTPIPNIWALQSKGDVGALIEALRHPEPTTRRGAAAALRALDAWQAVPALQAALAGEQDWQAHAAIAATLQYLDRDVHIQHLVQNKDIPGLAKMLGSSNIEDVKAACRALGDLGNRQAVEPLVILFRNPLMPNAARLAAAEALLKLESAPAVVTLLGKRFARRTLLTKSNSMSGRSHSSRLNLPRHLHPRRRLWLRRWNLYQKHQRSSQQVRKAHC